MAGMVKRPFTVPLNSSLTALLHLSDNVLVVRTIFYSLFSPHFEPRGGKPAFSTARHSPPDLDLLTGGCLVLKWLV